MLQKEKEQIEQAIASCLKLEKATNMLLSRQRRAHPEIPENEDYSWIKA